ncbi:exported hypothetical protein [Vibrio nigripulchritudo Wn13]|nr:exported hypothetical protein [Vibrio nigripulchritudo SFn135]CCO55141.1 exported hypothetical protein [Vibrio nigripulchritudo Wn13]
MKIKLIFIIQLKSISLMAIFLIFPLQIFNKRLDQIQQSKTDISDDHRYTFKTLASNERVLIKVQGKS